MRKTYWLMVVASVQASTVVAGIRLHTVPDSVPIAYGANPIFDSVGALYVEESPGVYSRGSGVLFDPDWALVRAHQVVGNNGFGGGIESMLFFTGADIANYSHRIEADIDDVIFHPLWEPGTHPNQGWDVALVKLAEPILDIVVAELYSGPTLPADTQVEIAGYGMYGDGLSGAVGADFLRRAGANLIDGTGVGLIDPQFYRSNFDPPGLFSRALPNELHAAPGDSGGGGFAVVDGRWQLVSHIDSVFGSGDLTRYLNDTIHHDVSTISDWAYASIPEPLTISLLVLGAFAARCKRRRPV
ncbi:MAG: trypsin-like serine protease [Phycisphaerales bacterium]|nr:trypsin-like serine protease [Phycisphaerales bacterium]